MGKKIMIFDDDADILEICRYILEARGYEVQTRQSCKQVLNDVRDFMPDVVIMDNWIPDKGGVEATRTIKKDPDLRIIPVILFSASKDVKSLVEQAMADAYIEKPFDISLLEETVEDILKT